MKQLALEYSELLDKIETVDRFVIKECKLFLKDAKAKAKYKENEHETKASIEEESYPLIDKQTCQEQTHQQLDQY